MLFFDRGPFRPNPDRSDDYNRGAYLVTASGRIAANAIRRETCWARPNRAAFSPVRRTGRDGKAVPNITPDHKTGIGNWSEDDIVGVLTDGHTPDFDFVGGAMAEVVKSTARLNAADRRAIAVYLKSLPPIGSPKKD